VSSGRDRFFGGADTAFAIIESSIDYIACRSVDLPDWKNG